MGYLLDIFGFKQENQLDEKVKIFLLTYYLLYNEFGVKQEISNYIKENKLAQYYDCDEIDENLRGYFPKIIPGSGLLEKEHYQLLYSLGYTSVPYEKDLRQIFLTLNMKISDSQHNKIISSWTSDFEKFICNMDKVLYSFTENTLDDFSVKKLEAFANWARLQAKNYYSKKAA